MYHSHRTRRKACLKTARGVYRNEHCAWAWQGRTQSGGVKGAMILCRLSRTTPRVTISR